MIWSLFGNLKFEIKMKKKEYNKIAKLWFYIWDLMMTIQLKSWNATYLSIIDTWKITCDVLNFGHLSNFENNWDIWLEIYFFEPILYVLLLFYQYNYRLHHDFCLNNTLYDSGEWPILFSYHWHWYADSFKWFVSINLNKSRLHLNPLDSPFYKFI